MIIRRSLQRGTWEYNTDTQEVKLQTTPDKWIILDRTYVFSVLRFLIRAAQKMSQKKRKKPAITMKKEGG